MGVSDYIIPYKTDEEKDKINKCINEYKMKYSKIPDILRNLEIFRNREEGYEIESNVSRRITDDSTLEDAKQIYPDIDFTGIDIHGMTIDKKYYADLLITTHQRIRFNSGTIQNAIRVFFPFGASRSFCKHLERGLRKTKTEKMIDFDFNEYYESTYTIEEEYKCILYEESGLPLEEYLDL